MEKYYVELSNGQLVGPYSLEQLKSLELSATDQIYDSSNQKWVAADVFFVSAFEGSTMNETKEQTVDVLSAEYYIALDGSYYGPYSFAELSYLDVDDETMVSVDGMDSWQLAQSIPNLLSTIQQFANGNKGKESVWIEEVKGQLQVFNEELKGEVEPTSSVAVYDMSTEGVAKYVDIEEDVCATINSVKTSYGQNEVYRKVFPSLEVERKYYIDGYRIFIDNLKSALNIVEVKLRGVQNEFDDDIIRLDNSVQAIHVKSVDAINRETCEIVEAINQQIAKLSDSPNMDIAIESLEQTLRSRRAEIVEKYNDVKSFEVKKVVQRKREVRNAFANLITNVISTINKVYKEGSEYYENYFNGLYETSNVDMSIWDKIDDRGTVPSSLIRVGNKQHVYSILGNDVVIVENFYVELLNNKNLIIRHNNNTKQKAHQIANSLVGRLMSCSSPGMVNVAMIDADEMDGTCDAFKFLNRGVFQIYARPDEVRSYLDSTERHIGNIIQNLLLGPIKTLFDYNNSKESKEAYHIIVLEDFPIGINSESMHLLQKIMKNGIRAGVNVVLLVNEDQIDCSEDTRKVYNSCHIEQMEQANCVFDLTMCDNVDNLEFEMFDDEQLRKIVQYVNSGVEVREEEAVPFSDYVPMQSEWWQRRSARYIEIPFGISENRQVQKLKITQESGQNSAVVIGIPGSGKSVFLHALICNAAIHYSPDELNMFLIDFSGVEFNSYALHNLPHARVIAPEAEREFGLSILNELVEEGARRMELCRKHDVSNIVDLKAKNPSMHIPRLLVVIDEFQKFFEVENDLISREAKAKIHTIIQEFRKFGINLILATQKLPSSSILPKDLIANRVVFKSSPGDFSALISLPLNGKQPQLRTGECVYNSESGLPYDNHRVQGFLVTKSEIDKLLSQLSDFAEASRYQRRDDMIVFRGGELPEFRSRRLAKSHQTPAERPESVGIYLGESISIHETDVCAILRKESANNLLILGGEPQVAQRIAYYATIAASTAHTDQSATFVTLNFVRREDALNEDIHRVFGSLPFSSQIVSKTAEIIESLTAIKEEVDERRKDEERAQNHIYISIYAFQLARMFDKGGRRGDDVSESGVLLDYILKNGPAVGVFTIMQCDNWDNLSRIGNPLSCFTYRVALQMTENDSNKVVGSSIANKLFVFNRPSSVFRAYFRDNNRNINIKFKPYK